MNCPVDQTPLHQAGYTVKCDRCQGAWVKEDVLVPLLEQHAAAFVELDWRQRIDGPPRACPECGTPMQTVELGDVALDRCPAHGVWFDKGELTQALDEAKLFRAPPKPHESLLHKLGKLLQID